MNQTEWVKAQAWEREWHGTCQNTYGEEEKQLLYANRMGLIAIHDGQSPYNFDLKGTSVLDIGGGPVSLLLKCVNFRGKVVDPLDFPAWVLARYELAGIEFEQLCGEDIVESGWDECWIYNTLQHVEDPERVIHNAQRAASLVRIFEWLGVPVSEGHCWTLTEAMLNSWLGGEGRIEQLSGSGCYGKAYYGIFPGRRRDPYQEKYLEHPARKKSLISRDLRKS